MRRVPTGCAQSGKLWFALGRLGTLLLAWTCWLVWSFYGTLDLAAISQLAAGAPQNMALWLPGLLGFALLAGVIPLHGWAPQAHAGASAPAAALFYSGDEGRSVRHPDRVAGR